MKIGDNVIHNDEHMTIGILPDVLFDRNGGYHKMTDDDINLGKFNIGNRYYNTMMQEEVTLRTDITHKSSLSGDIMIETSYECDERTNSSVKYLRPIEVEHKFNIGDKVKMVSDSYTSPPSGTIGKIIDYDDVVMHEIPHKVRFETDDELWVSDGDIVMHTRKLDTDDKLSYGKWNLEVTDDELVITNEFPDDVIKLPKSSNGWIRNADDKVVHDW